jgi:hypothetical protein
MYSWTQRLYPAYLMTLTSIAHHATRAGSAVTGAVNGAPWWAMIGIILLSLATEFAWRVYTDPALAREWIAIFDERRDRRRRPRARDG